jgi:hypothetical protein
MKLIDCNYTIFNRFWLDRKIHGRYSHVYKLVLNSKHEKHEQKTHHIFFRHVSDGISR